MGYNKKLTVLDLFSGCGGLSYGFEQAGFDVLLGVDNWQPALDTFELNHTNSKSLLADISELSLEKVLEQCEGQEIDVIVGGPPCQGFSLSGPRNFDDPRNRLYIDFIRLVGEIRPRAFVIENVPGLARLFKGEIKQEIINALSALGYNVAAEILDAAAYGVPQHRKRIFFVGVREGEFTFPKPTHGPPPAARPYVTVRDALSDLPLLRDDVGNESANYVEAASTNYQKSMRSKSTSLLNHVAAKHTEQTRQIIALVPEGMNYKALPEEYRSSRNFNVAWTRLDGKKPSSTVDTGHRHHFHPTENRVPTVREFARLQSFPDSFRFLGSRTAQHRQVGNAVPPILAREIALELKKVLENAI